MLSPTQIKQNSGFNNNSNITMLCFTLSLWLIFSVLTGWVSPITVKPPSRDCTLWRKKNCVLIVPLLMLGILFFSYIHLISHINFIHFNWVAWKGRIPEVILSRVSPDNKVRPEDRELRALHFPNSAWILLRLTELWTLIRFARRDLRFIILIHED